MSRIYNFSAGPATLPLPVLEQAQQEMTDWRGSGMSVMEMSHRSKEYMSVAHQIEAGADMFIMPSRFEPCGLNQMYSLRYGTVPLVRATGGLADSVRHFDPESGEGTGVVFHDFDANGLRWALNSALDLHANKRAWRHVVFNGMEQNYSWQEQGEEAVRKYKKGDEIETVISCVAPFAA